MIGISELFWIYVRYNTLRKLSLGPPNVAIDKRRKRYLSDSDSDRGHTDTDTDSGRVLNSRYG